jgi:hypothetical protein
LQMYCLDVVLFLFWWDWSLNSGLNACEAGVILLEPKPPGPFCSGCFVHSSFWSTGVWTQELTCKAGTFAAWATPLAVLVILEMGSQELFARTGLKPRSIQAAKVTGVSHQHWADFCSFVRESNDVTQGSLKLRLLLP